MRAPAAAGPVFELVDVVHGLVFLFFPIVGRFCFCSCLCFLPFAGYAAIAWLSAVSAFTPMAQMKPSSSRPTAVTILRWSLPAAASLA